MKMSQIAMKVSWSFFLLFFVLSIFDVKFALLGLTCMFLPLYQSLRGRGKIHCSGYCPRGSFLHNFFSKVSMRKAAPAFVRSSMFKNGVLLIMMGFFIVSLYFAGGDYVKSAMVVLRMVIVSTVIASLLGLIFKPRTWCTVCPMGHLSGTIARYKKK